MNQPSNCTVDLPGSAGYSCRMMQNKHHTQKYGVHASGALQSAVLRGLNHIEWLGSCMLVCAVAEQHQIHTINASTTSSNALKALSRYGSQRVFD